MNREIPPTFVAKCKEVYPNFVALHKHLDAGSVMVGRFLDDSAVFRSAGKLLKMPTKKLIQFLRAEDEKNKLYEEWYRLYMEERNGD